MLFKKKGAEEHNIWMSFADLFSGLMVVFILISIVLFTQTKTDCKLPCNELNTYKTNSTNFLKLRAIEQALDKLESSGLFVYNKRCDRYELKEDVIFAPGDYQIPSINQSNLILAGQALDKIIKSFQDTSGLKFHIIIEGRTARQWNKPAFENESKHNYNVGLSQLRAARVHSLWYSNGLLQSSNVEVYDAGSGNFGLCRYSPPNGEEESNRRIIVQIIPYLR